jgi:membrane protease YdiL (CAAX protease family)
MSLLRTFARRALDAVVHPTVRLKVNPEFPLTGKTLGKAYVVGFLLFIAGSFAPILLFFGAVILMAYYGSPETTNHVMNVLFADHGEPRPLLLAALMMASFLGGFAFEMSYLRRLLHRKGYRVREVVGLSVAPMRGRKWFITAWNIGWRAVLTFLFALGCEQFLSLFIHAPDQPTIEYARKLTGGTGWIFVLLAAGFAPVLEEFCFRGILFQALRSTFHGYITAAAGATTGATSRFGRWAGRLLKNGARADFAAVFLSGLIFALYHMQFHPVHLLLLTGMGMVLAEAFRRSGTLWTSIAVHALNNGVMALLVIYGGS